VAQEPTVSAARVEQAQRFRPEQAEQDEARQRLTPAFDDQAPASPGDPDLGQQVILKKSEKATPFNVFANVSGFFTSNAALTDANVVSDYFLVAEVGGSFQRVIARDLYAEVTIRQATFRYSEFNELDFDSMNVGAGLTYVLRPIWGVAVSARYNYNRLTDGAEHREFFKNQTLTLSALKTFELSKAHYAYVGFSSVFGWSDPVAPQRDEYGLFLGYRVNFTRSISADLYYRIALFDYVQNREDLNQTLALSLKWEPVKGLALSASVSGGFNNSNQDVFNYQVFNGGVGLAGSVSF